jgi:hypothetical protein
MPFFLSPFSSYIFIFYIPKSLIPCNLERIRRKFYERIRRNGPGQVRKPETLWRMPSSGMLHRVALVRTDVSEEPSTSIIRVTKIGELGTLAVASNQRTLRGNAKFLYLYFFVACVGCYLRLTFLVRWFLSPWWWMGLSFSETLVLTRATRRNIPEDAILHSHRLENLKSYREAFFLGNLQQRQVLHRSKIRCRRYYSMHCVVT